MPDQPPGWVRVKGWSRARRFGRVWLGLAVACSAIYGVGRGTYELAEWSPFAAIVVWILAWITAVAVSAALTREGDL